jgi:hypothetical protein
MARRERSGKARRKWQRLISEQARSGQSVAAFCRERELSRSHFWWWKKRLRTPFTKFVEVKLTPAVLEGAEAGPVSRAEGLARPVADPPLVGEGACGSGAPEWAEPVGGARVRRWERASDAGGAGERGMRGLPSLRALDEDATAGPRASPSLAREAQDMRCGFERLAERVRAADTRRSPALHGTGLNRVRRVAPAPVILRPGWGAYISTRTVGTLARPGSMNDSFYLSLM